MTHHPQTSPPAHSSEAFHVLDAARVLQMLGSDRMQGLSMEEANKRLADYGPNELKETERASPWMLLLSQFKNVLIVILLIATALSAVLGHEMEAAAIAAIVLFAVILGFVQEYRAEKAMEALRKMAAPTATVIRSGEEFEIPARELVPGDVVILSTGDRIPADGRLIESMNLQADEASLTGESLPAEKQIDRIEKADAPLGDRRNMVYAGTAVTYGRGRAVITATGMATEFGKIAGMLQTVETSETPLQKNLDRVGKSLAKAALVVIVLISVLGYLRDQPLLEVVIFAIALAVAVVPEALPAVVTISLAIGVQRMAKKHALVRRLPAVETLGSTSVICSDKTGTLTKDEMTVRRLYVSGQRIDISGSGYEPKGEFSQEGKSVTMSDDLLLLLRAGTLASDAHVIHHPEDGWDVRGDPTEGALVVAAAKVGLKKDALDEEEPRTAEIPFSSETKRMTTLHQTKKGVIAYAKGAPEILLSLCTTVRINGAVVDLTEERKNEILAAAKAMAESALRVLAVASRENATLQNAEQEITFIGLFGMIDPPRPEAKSAVAACKQAGIKVVMITGDHPVTATAIAKELGILANGKVVTGAELEVMDDATLDRDIESIDVYARVSPAHKMRVVTALQKKGHVVAMTGDGVNDAPSLKKADIGIAMGITGTDVTKEASAMMLTDDNFASIVAAVEEGRGIFGNIKKYLMYLLSSNIGEICLMVGASLAGVPLPLSAVQILYVNLATDGLPALALAVDTPEPDLMRRPPRDPRRSIFSKKVVALMCIGGLWSMVINLGLFLWALRSDRSLAEAMTMTFVSLVLIQFFKAYNFRSDHVSAFKRPFANKWLNIAILWELVLLALILYVPFLQIPFETFPLPAIDIVIITALAFTVTPVLEFAKWMLREK